MVNLQPDVFWVGVFFSPSMQSFKNIDVFQQRRLLKQDGPKRGHPVVLALNPPPPLHVWGCGPLPREGAGSWGHLCPREPHMASARVWRWRCESIWQLPLGSPGCPQASSHQGPWHGPPGSPLGPGPCSGCCRIPFVFGQAATFAGGSKLLLGSSFCPQLGQAGWAGGGMWRQELGAAGGPGKQEDLGAAKAGGAPLSQPG